MEGHRTSCGEWPTYILIVLSLNEGRGGRVEECMYGRMQTFKTIKKYQMGGELKK